MPDAGGENKKNLSRRSFLKEAVYGAAGIAAGSAAVRSIYDASKKKESLPDLGRVEMELPEKKESPKEQKDIREEK